ncbi:MAG: hypothetical protein JNL58_12825 [Planctomyces sp.]|nr:hypothetical protein [Planctomyces sp.]
MAFEPQRFIHAANVRLDVPVSVQTSDVLTDDLRVAFEDATLHSFECVIQNCIARSVDYLLLSGNIFVEADRSLRARLSLLNGLRILDSKRIRVFVLPGDTDPPEAWRQIPEMPGNVTICYSSNPEPAEFLRGDKVIATISSSMWYGEKDAFGIQVIAQSVSGIQPFRIGLVSESKFEEAERMAAMAAESSDELIASALDEDGPEEVDLAARGRSGKLVPISGKPKTAPVTEDLADLLDEEQQILPGVPEVEATVEESANGESLAEEWNSDFVTYLDQIFREGHLNYLALTGELARATLRRPAGVMHCPGTTQPRNRREAAVGTCSLVQVSAEGRVEISTIDTSAVDWKDIEIHVAAQTTLSSMLQFMKTRLSDQVVNPSDRIWSVQWTIRCSLPVMRELVADDLDVAVSIELDELKVGSQLIRLLHNIRLVPNGWRIEDEKSLAQRYSMMAEGAIDGDEVSLQRWVDSQKSLSPGWKQRLSALMDGLDRERIVSRLRSDGASWFIQDLSVLLPDASEMSLDELDEEDPDNIIDELETDELDSEELVESEEATEEYDEDYSDTDEEDSEDSADDEFGDREGD